MATTLDVITKEMNGIEARVAENFEATGPAGAFALHKSESSGLHLELYEGISPLTGAQVVAYTTDLIADDTYYFHLNRDGTITKTATTAPAGWASGSLANGAWPIGSAVAGATTFTWADVRRFGAPPILGIPYAYSSTTTAADPGSGTLRFNNATLSSATALYISETDGLGRAIAALIALWDDGSGINKSRLTVSKTSDPSVFAIFNVTGTNTDNGTWDTVNLTYVAGAGSLANGDAVTVLVLANGDLGSPASVSGTGIAFVTAGSFDATASAVGSGIMTWLATPSSANLRAALTDETGGGAAVFADTPTLVTPVLGVATATSINKVAITAPAASATLTIANGKTATFNHSITFAGTDATTMTFPSTTATLARTDAANTFTGVQVFSSAPQISSLTAGRVLIAGTSGAVNDDGGLTYDAANDRLMVGTATTIAGQDFWVQKNTNGQVAILTQNQSTGTGAYSSFIVYNSANRVTLQKLSTGFTTSGLFVADQASLFNSTGSMLITNEAAADFIFSRGGFAATDEKFRIGATGPAAMAATAIPAGGTAGTGYRFSSTANFGVFFGSGAPTLSAAKGSYYARSDGSGTNDRGYINTDGGTTWTAIVTVA